MIFTLPLALLSLVAVPMILGIYFLRRRFKTRTVSALFLWMDPELRTGGGRKISRLEKSALILIEMAIAAALAAAAASPGCKTQMPSFRAAYVLDDSASMSAKDGRGSSPAERAKNAILGELESRAPFSCSIILTGKKPSMLLSETTDMKDVLNCLGDWNPKQTHHSCEPAISLATRLLGSESGEIVFVTDRPPEKDEERMINSSRMRWLAFGDNLPNAAISAAGRNPISGSENEKLFALVTANGLKGGEIPISVKAGARILAKENLRIPQNLADGDEFRKKIEIEMPPSFREPVMISIDAEDALDCDNRVLLCPNPDPPLRIGIAIADPSLKEIVSEAVSALEGECVISDASPELLFEDSGNISGNAGDSAPARSWLFSFDPPIETEKKIGYGPYLVDKQSPACDGVLLDGVKWTSGRKIPLSRDILALIASDDRALLWECLSDQKDSSPRIFHMNFIPAGSNLQKTPAFPILIGNIVKMRKDARYGFHRHNYKTDDIAEAFLPSGTLPVLDAVSIGPDAKKIKEDEISRLHCAETDGMELARVFSQLPSLCRIAGKDFSDAIAFNFISPEESDLRGRRTGKWSGVRERPEIMKTQWRDYSWIPLLIALSLLFLHSYVLKRMEIG